MKIVFFMLFEILVIFSRKESENIQYLKEGYYEINSRLNNLYLSVKNKELIFSNIKFSFYIIPITNISYFIQFKRQNLGINDNNNLIIYNNIENIEIKKYSWNINCIRRNLYFIQNLYNNKLTSLF